jgi:hypothetical protein
MTHGYGAAVALTFGLFPLGIAGSPDGLATGPPDDFEQIGAAVRELQGDGPALLARMYAVYEGSVEKTLEQVAELAASGIAWDLSLGFHDPGGDVAGWCELVEQVVLRHGRELAAIGVTGEANLTGVPGAPDGAYPRAFEALVDGLVRAGEAKRAAGATAAIGFTAATDRDRRTSFWKRVAARGGDELVAALDFAGINLYPDVFGPPIPVEELGAVTAWLLGDYRERALAQAGIPHSVPIRICESGWPTGPGRSEERQAQALEAVIRGAASVAGVTHWELFTLRDADSGKDDIFHRFGVLRDDYSRKPAFHVLKRLIAELVVSPA